MGFVVNAKGTGSCVADVGRFSNCDVAAVLPLIKKEKTRSRNLVYLSEISRNSSSASEMDVY